jgi:hypothetical protein
MRRRLTWLLLSLVVVAGLPAPSATEPRVETDPTTPVLAHHPMLQASLARLASGSRLWRDAVRSLEGSGRRALVLTPDQVKIQDRDSATPKPFNPELLAETYPVVVSGSQVGTVLVVVNVALLRDIYHSRPWSSPADVHGDLDRIVIHEVYGHAFPYLLAGNISGRCPDAMPGQRANDACAIQRENAVRGELQLGMRQDAGVDGLSLINRAVMWPAQTVGWLR